MKNNLMKRMLFLMVLGCLEKTNCDWRDSWNKLKSETGYAWGQLKDKVEEKWHNFENKSNNENIIQKFDANDMKNFLSDPNQKEFEFESVTGKNISFHKASINDGIFIYSDGLEVANFDLYDLQGRAVEVQSLISKAIKNNLTADNELLDFIKILGIKATDDFDTFLTLVDNVKNGEKNRFGVVKSGFCVFKNNNNEFIIFQLFDENSLSILSVSKNGEKNHIKTDDLNYKNFIKPYFNEKQLVKFYKKTVQK